MHGKTIISILICIIVFVLGWTVGQFMENVSPFILDWSISVSDVLAITVEIGIAIIIAWLVERGMQNQRVEKDFFISELDDAQHFFSELEKDCSRLSTLSLQQTIFQVEKNRKDLMKMWETIEIRNKRFHDKNNSVFDNLIKTIKIVNSQISDSNYFNEKDGFKPVKINKGVIYLNNTIIATIIDTLDSIKDYIFKMKIAINDM